MEDPITKDSMDVNIYYQKMGGQGWQNNGPKMDGETMVVKDGRIMEVVVMGTINNGSFKTIICKEMEIC